MIAVERLLQAVDTDPPCGPNLEYDAAYLELERLAKGRPEQQMGDTVNEAEEPDWPKVASQAAALLESSKDLRVALLLTRALLRTRGWAGLAEGLAIVAGLLDLYWDHLHPQLDPDDDNDPIMRINALAGLTDAATVLAWVRATPLVRVRALGSYTLRDLALVTGELSPAEGESAPDAASIEAAFAAVELDELSATAQAAAAARDHLASIESITTERAGVGMGADLSKLRVLLDQAVKTLDQRLVQRGATGNSSTAAGAPANGAGSAAPLSGVVASREQVVEALDKIIAYYERNEPSSPIPLLLTRCKRLVRMTFMDIVRDIAPDAVSAVEALRGRIEQGD